VTEGRINLYSDTQTRPPAAMREVMASAPVGDEQRFADPSVNALCERVAGLLGKEAAVFLPSGTMCNEIALAVHCRAGDEVYAHESAHVVHFEGGGPAAIAGALVRPLPGERGMYAPQTLRAAIRDGNRYAPRPGLVEVEQTANLGGGAVWPLDRLEGVAAVARERGLPLHMDGARLMNAVVASGIGAADFAAVADSAWIDLSKGLACPMGAVLAGSRGFVDEAWRWKQRLGGALRQAGIVAAAGLYALDHHVERLAEDHANARRFAAAVATVEGVTLPHGNVDTNIVFLDVSGTGIPAPALSAALERRDINLGAMGENLLRAVTHLDVNASMVDEAAAAFVEVVTAMR
jgi:threonine aldolase